VREFPIQKEVDEDGELLMEEDEDKRFKIAGAGDHLMISFQCKLCNFRHILIWNPNQDDPNALEILDTMRRSNHPLWPRTYKRLSGWNKCLFDLVSLQLLPTWDPRNSKIVRE
jgi:hypothetical protein